MQVCLGRATIFGRKSFHFRVASEGILLWAVALLYSLQLASSSSCLGEEAGGACEASSGGEDETLRRLVSSSLLRHEEKVESDSDCCELMGSSYTLDSHQLTISCDTY